MSNSNLLPEEAQNDSLPFSQVWTCEEKGLANRIRAVWCYAALPPSDKKDDKDAIRPTGSLSSFSAGLRMQERHGI